jgi:hypothetical protein
MNIDQYEALMALLISIRDLVQVSPNLQTGLVLLMFGLGWSSAG